MKKTPTFVVRHKDTGLLFAGFDSGKNLLWTDDKTTARHHPNREAAESQAILFARFGINAQRKAVTL